MIWATGFLPGIFSGGKVYCYANFFCYAIVFGPNFREKSPRGVNCLRGASPCPPVEESQAIEDVPVFRG